MTVAQLIEILQELDGSLQVGLMDEQAQDFYKLANLEISTIDNSTGYWGINMVTTIVLLS